MTRVTAGKVLLTLTSLYAGVGPYIFDWNETHIYNPNWSPHAKFHNAQTMSLGAGLGLSALGVLWGGRQPWSKGRLQVATGAASMYWATQLTSLAYPGVALTDPPAKKQYAQAIVASAALAVNLFAYITDNRILTSEPRYGVGPRIA